MTIERALIAKEHFSGFLAAQEKSGGLHFAAHSHHLWPDVTRAAQVACWDDAAARRDDKWDHIFGAVVPEAQGHVARRLGLSRSADIAFAPNTHEFVNRLFSCLEAPSPPRVLSTDGEFHSFRRQSRRLAEAGLIDLIRVAVEPFASFEERFAAALAGSRFDLVYFSQVFFDSGFAVKDLGRLCRAVADPETLIVIDGYHAFMALPVDLGAIEGRIFYLGGGYKYAMSGEGACFLHVPAESRLRPLNTGWFAEFGALEKAPEDAVAYGAGGARFFGSTFDPSGLYRLNAVMRLLDNLGVEVADIHAHVIALQDAFLDRARGLGPPIFSADNLLGVPGAAWRGHFLTFQHADAAKVNEALWRRGVVADVRGERLRLGFGAYHDLDDVSALTKHIAAL